LVRSGGREAVEELLSAPEPLDQRLWRHERDASPLSTPEARAGLRQRLIEHSQAIADPELRRLYRDQWMDRYQAEMAQARPPKREWKPNPPGKFQRGRFTPSPGPVGAVARRIASSGIDAATARALILGFVNFPEALAPHCEQLAALAIPDATLSALRDKLVDAALSAETLDRQALATILQASGTKAGQERPLSSGGIGFSFTHSDAEPERAVRDLGVAIDALAAEEEIGAALEAATERLKAGDEEAFDEQLRLHVAREEIKQRLASLAGTE
jgi:DNA primase